MMTACSFCRTYEADHGGNPAMCRTCYEIQENYRDFLEWRGDPEIFLDMAQGLAQDQQTPTA